MSAWDIVVLIIGNLICGRAAQLIAPTRGRSARFWMFLTVFTLGILILGLLVILPRKKPAVA